MPKAYYNEIDPLAAQWLRNLIEAGLIAPGEVDERSIEDVLPNELAGYTQCHFFAGIGVWSYALRQAGWPDSRPVWTGSCPCQPFSTAGKGQGIDDERHLWPHFYWLIEQCKPISIFGEQVASKDGLAWLDLVQADLEKSDYASAAIDLCAAGFGAPNIRQRLFWMAHTSQQGRKGRVSGGANERGENKHRHVGCGSTASRLAHLHSNGRYQSGKCSTKTRNNGACGNSGVIKGAEATRGTPTNGFWRNADWLLCQDEKWRAVEPCSFPLVDGATARVGRLRGYGNAINAEVAAEFIRAASEVIEEQL